MAKPSIWAYQSNQPWTVAPHGFGILSDNARLWLNAVQQVLGTVGTIAGKPISSAWGTSTPTITPSGGTVTVTSAELDSFQLGPVCLVNANLSITLGGSAGSNPYINVSLPIPPASGYSFFSPAQVWNGTTWNPLHSDISLANAWQFTMLNNAQFPGGAILIQGLGLYPC